MQACRCATPRSRMPKPNRLPEYEETSRHANEARRLFSMAPCAQDRKLQTVAISITFHWNDVGLHGKVMEAYDE
ncbi:hypothetical protein BAG01nite_01950 [Brevibacillus agri]|uniref:Uncharacterized protein n=1 Tax=Brevibacillus agri TaxID=51101 RepID=A0ABQ0SJS9_9BACL|nr:hypothetical protein BAG01nite_01950 [Brevibacillus agri]